MEIIRVEEGSRHHEQTYRLRGEHLDFLTLEVIIAIFLGLFLFFTFLTSCDRINSTQSN